MEKMYNGVCLFVCLFVCLCLLIGCNVIHLGTNCNLIEFHDLGFVWDPHLIDGHDQYPVWLIFLLLRKTIFIFFGAIMSQISIFIYNLSHKTDNRFSHSQWMSWRRHHTSYNDCWMLMSLLYVNSYSRYRIVVN